MEVLNGLPFNQSDVGIGAILCIISDQEETGHNHLTLHPIEMHFDTFTNRADPYQAALVRAV